ncbi:MAG: Protein HflC [Pseudomonadota bacterium]|jgi:membrane protease subunit HflC
MIRGFFLLGLGLLALGLSSLFVIDETEQAIVTQFGQYRWSAVEPGLHFKVPFMQEVHRMERRVIGRDTAAGDYLTLDKKKLVADPVTRWKIIDPLTFYQRVQDEVRAARRLDDIVKSELRSEISSHRFDEIIGSARSPLMRAVTGRVQEKAKEFGIYVVDVRIKRADLPREVQESVFQRMRAERDREAKRYRSEGAEEAAKIRARTDKEVTILLAKAYQEAEALKGAGEADATRIYAGAYGKDPEFYALLRSLEAYEKSITPETEVVMSTESELFRYLARPLDARGTFSNR